MNPYFIDYPHYLTFKEYEKAINRMINKLNNQKGIVSIYQIGSMSNPGISDIDMLVVFEDGIENKLNPFDGLSKLDRYLFCHNLYGIPQSFFRKVQLFLFFHKYNLVWGSEQTVKENTHSMKEVNFLKSQIALEYLIKMFINMTVEHIYKIIKIRGLLLHTNALLYDLDFLGIFSGRLFDLLKRVILWRKNWFNNVPDKRILKKWHNDLYTELVIFLENILKTRNFYLPKDANFQIARNMYIVPSERFEYIHKGIILPSIFAGLGKKYFNLQNRFNRFVFKLTASQKDIPDIVLKRHKLITELGEYNKKHIPYFVPVAYGLQIY